MSNRNDNTPPQEGILHKTEQHRTHISPQHYLAAVPNNTAPLSTGLHIKVPVPAEGRGTVHSARSMAFLCRSPIHMTQHITNENRKSVDQIMNMPHPTKPTGISRTHWRTLSKVQKQYVSDYWNDAKHGFTNQGGVETQHGVPETSSPRRHSQPSSILEGCEKPLFQDPNAAASMGEHLGFSDDYGIDLPDVAWRARNSLLHDQICARMEEDNGHKSKNGTKSAVFEADFDPETSDHEIWYDTHQYFGPQILAPKGAAAPSGSTAGARGARPSSGGGAESSALADQKNEAIQDPGESGAVRGNGSPSLDRDHIQRFPVPGSWPEPWP